jgi:hypothetical protein
LYETSDDKLPLMKNSVQNSLLRPRQAGRYMLSNEQLKLVREMSKGDLLVPVKVTDETGEEVIIAEMNWRG